MTDTKKKKQQFTVNVKITFDCAIVVTADSFEDVFSQLRAYKDTDWIAAFVNDRSSVDEVTPLIWGLWTD